MSTQENIERIEAPTRSVFERCYLRKGRPVVITNLFDGQPIRRLSTIRRMRHRLGQMPIRIRPEYFGMFEKFGVVVSPGYQDCTVNDYLTFVDANPATNFICTEHAAPPAIQELYQLPIYCEYNRQGGDPIPLVFLGNRGNFAHLHFDGDCRHVLMYQVCGNKRIILIPATRAKLLAAVKNFSTVRIEQMTEADKRAFVQFMGGYDFTLRPGETAYMPPAIWHYLEYTTTSLSLGLRFGRNSYLSFLASGFHLDIHLQNIAAKMLDDRVVRRKYRSELALLRRAMCRKFASRREKYLHMQALYEEIYGRICTDAIPRDYILRREDLFLREMDHQLAMTGLYQ